MYVYYHIYVLHEVRILYPFRNLGLYLHCAPLSPIVSHYFKPHLLSPGLPDEHVNFQATSSMSPWASLVAWTAINNIVFCLVKGLSLFLYIACPNKVYYYLLLLTSFALSQVFQ